MLSGIVPSPREHAIDQTLTDLMPWTKRRIASDGSQRPVQCGGVEPTDPAPSLPACRDLKVQNRLKAHDQFEVRDRLVGY